MLNIVNVVHHLGVGITNSNLVVNNGGVDVQKHILIDGYSQNVTAMLAVKRREIGAPSAERHPERSSRNNHAPPDKIDGFNCPSLPVLICASPLRPRVDGGRNGFQVRLFLKISDRDPRS